MKRIRKKRAPEIRIQNILPLDEIIDDLELQRLAYRFEYLEELREKRYIPTAYVALEAIGALAQARSCGRTDQKLKEIWPESWGAESVSLPLGVVLVLSEIWKIYLKDEFGKTMGEAFEIEGGSQGNHKIKSKLTTFDKYLVYARDVEILYLGSQLSDEPLSLEAAIDAVATKNGVGFGTIKHAHKKFRDYIRKHLRDAEILKG